MSISDIVALKQGGVVSCHYVDRYAFSELPGFFSGRNPLRAAEDSIEQNDNQLDGIIHNHIIWNSTTLDCKGKFRDFLRSAMVVRRLSDLVCLEHRLSILKNPKRGSLSYNKWLGERAKLSQREQLWQAIDAALERRPADLDALLALLAGAGIAVQRRGKSISLRTGTGKKFLRLDRLGDGYGDAGPAPF